MKKKVVIAVSDLIHPHTELRYMNNQIGFGILATQFIPKGTVTWALDLGFMIHYVNSCG